MHWITFTGNYSIFQVSIFLVIFGLLSSYKTFIRTSREVKNVNESLIIRLKNTILSYIDVITNLLGISRQAIIFDFIVKGIMYLIFSLALIQLLNLTGSQVLVLNIIGVGFFVYWSFGRRERIIKKYRESFELEFTEFVDSLALAVNSGLAMTSGLFRVMDDYLQETDSSNYSNSRPTLKGRIQKGLNSSMGLASKNESPLIREIRLLHHSIIQGEPLVVALDNLSRRIGSPLVSNFSDAIAISVARGTPLANLLRDHAKTLRESHKRKLLDRAGKAEVKMMVPVIFLLLPVSVLFALWPSFQQLQQLVINP